MAAAASPGLIYTWQTTPTPRLGIANTAGSVVLAWTVPSMKFVLQQNSDLATTNWTDLTISPKLNYTSLNYEASLQPTNGPMFYRLASE